MSEPEPAPSLANLSLDGAPPPPPPPQAATEIQPMQPLDTSRKSSTASASTVASATTSGSKSSFPVPRPNIPNPLRSLSNLHTQMSTKCADKKEAKRASKASKASKATAADSKRRGSEDFGIKGAQPSCQLFNVFKALAQAQNEGDEKEKEQDKLGKSVSHPSSSTNGSSIKTPVPSVLSIPSSHSSVDTSSDTVKTTPDADRVTAQGVEAFARRASIINADHLAGLAAEREEEAAVAAAAAAAGTDSEAVKAWLRETVSKNRSIGRYGAVTSRMEEIKQDAAVDSDFAGSDDEDDEDEDEWHDPTCATVDEPKDPDQTGDTKVKADVDVDTATATRMPRSSVIEIPPAQDLLAMSEDEVHSLFRRDHIPAEEKLAVIQAEFGDIASKFVADDGTSPPERLLAESQGSLFKGVMMIGNLHLTTHRLVFHALLPPDNLYSEKNVLPVQTEEEAMAKDSRPNIIIAGPVYVHRSNPLKRQRRVWLELAPDMLTSYPSADEAGRVHPLHSILLSTILKLAPYDEEKPLDFRLKYWSSVGEHTLHFSVDNDMSAIRWRRHFEAILFRHAKERFRESHFRDNKLTDAENATNYQDLKNQWGLLRCCVPLDRGVVKGVGEFHSFATLINLQVSLDEHTKISWHPEELAKGNFAEYHKGMLPAASAPSVTPASGGPTSSFSGSVNSGLNTGLSSGGSTPTRSRSLRKVLPGFSKRSSKKEGGTGSSRESSPQRSPLSATVTSSSMNDDDSEPPSPSGTNLHRSLPPRLNTLTRKSIQGGHVDPAPEDHPTNVFDFLVAILNKESWFAVKVTDAMAEAHRLHLVEGATPTKMVLDVGGYDCLAADDEHETSSVDDEQPEDDDDDHGKPVMVVEASKAQKAAMAARLFGLREDEGIYLKRCYVQHNHLLARGHIIITPRYICFWRRANIGADIKYRFSTRDIKGAEVDAPLRPRLHGIKMHINGHHDLKIQLFSEKGRNELLKRINEAASISPPSPTTPGTPGTPSRVSTSSTTSMSTAPSIISPIRTTTSTSGDTASDQATISTMSSDMPVTPTTSTQTNDERWSNTIKDLKDSPPKFDINPAVIATGGLDVLKRVAEVLAPPPDMLLYPKSMSEQALSYMPFVANFPWSRNIGWNVRLTARTFTMLTIGSRGDVQPYIALGVRLMQDGHKCVIVTHEEFKDWIESYGIEHRQAGGDPTALMKLSNDHKMFSPGFFKEALGGYRAWLDQLLLDSWHACQDADVLIESPSAMAGVHIAEALKIPYFRAFTMPWTRTSAYPQAFMVPAFDMGPSFNYSSYVLFDNIMWAASSGQINRWRKKTLHLGGTDQSVLSISKVPFLYNFSPAVVPKPLDWEDDITITGYWNLENSDMDWTPPDSLIVWMDKAKAEGKKIVYIGFGSIVVPDPAGVTRSIIDGVERSGVRAIIAKGWSARDSKDADDVAFPPSCYSVDKVPHGWLFPKIDAAMHHGGAGTTGASLRAGLPTLIKPWFGDQYFWALRVAKLGAGTRVSSLRADDIADALRKATTSTVMIEKAARIGERIRGESGVDVAVQTINFNLVRAAKNRSKLKKEDNRNRADASGGIKLGLPSLPSITCPTSA